MNLVYTIINLIVLFLLLRHFLIKPVSDIMEKRRQMIADGLQGAQDAQSDAQKMKQEYEDALNQDCKIMAMVELSDIYGALEALAENYNLSMQDLATFSNITKRAFINGVRK